MTLRAPGPHALIALVAAGLVCAGVGVAISTADGRGATVSPALTRSARTTRENRRAAIRDAARLLAGVTPPSGAIVQSRRTATGVQRRVPLLSSAFASALASERWSVPGRPGSVLSYVESHLPRGSKLVSTGSGGSNPSSQSVIRSWAPVTGVLDGRWLEIDVAGQSSGGTLLHAESQSQWIVVRPARERIPAGVKQIDVTRGFAGRRPQLSRRVTARGRVRKLVALFDSLGIVQPDAVNCPGESSRPATVTVRFRGGSGRVLATATVDARADFSWPDSVPGWACYSIAFTAGGHHLHPLIGNVIDPIDHLLHLHLQRH